MWQEKFFDTGKVKINNLDYGFSSAEPLVMLHGGAWCWQEYLSLIRSLSGRWHVYALDLRGNGKSDWAPGTYRLQDFTEDNLEFVRELNAPAVLVGHSLGGVVALMVAARCPAKMKALIIEDSPLTRANYKKIIDSSRDMFGLWLELKKSVQSEQELSLSRWQTNTKTFPVSRVGGSCSLQDACGGLILLFSTRCCMILTALPKDMTTKKR